MPLILPDRSLSPAHLGAVILAAGRSRRAAPHNKLLLPGRDGEPVIRGIAQAFCAAGVGVPIIVTGNQREAIEAALTGLAVRFVYAADFAAGLGRSLAAGIQAVPLDCPGFLVCPGDLPRMTSALVHQVATAFAAEGGTRNIIPTYRGVRGHPVALVADLRTRLEMLAGDQGAKALLSSDAERARTRLFPVGSDAIYADNDFGQNLE